MNTTWDQIAKANETIGTTDIKGKDYAMVNQRVKAFRMVYPSGFIMSKIVEDDGNICKCEASVGYYDENGQRVVVATGTAFEVKAASYINKTSYIENCETSAVGRALGFAGFGIDTSICSAEELSNALAQQDVNAYRPRERASAPQSQVDEERLASVLDLPPETPGDAAYRCKCMKAYAQAQLDKACLNRFNKDFAHTPVAELKTVLPDEVIDQKLSKVLEEENGIKAGD